MYTAMEYFMDDKRPETVIHDSVSTNASVLWIELDEHNVKGRSHPFSQQLFQLMWFAFVQPKWPAHCTLDEITYGLPIAFRMGWTFGFSTNYVRHNQ